MSSIYRAEKGIIGAFKKIGEEFKRNKILFLMILPAVIFFFVFSYLPMGGLIVAFKDYNYAGGIFGSEWNGLKNFEFFFSSGQAWQLTKNTIL